MESERFQVRYGTVAALECASHVKAGLVTDISRDGLSFRYLDHGIDNQEEPNWPSHKLKISWNAKKDFYIDKVPCEILSDRLMPVKESYSYVPMRKCSVRFGEMTPGQRSKVEYFIENFTKDSTDKSPDRSQLAESTL